VHAMIVGADEFVLDRARHFSPTGRRRSPNRDNRDLALFDEISECQTDAPQEWASAYMVSKVSAPSALSMILRS
jgi:hypothetical protein